MYKVLLFLGFVVLSLAFITAIGFAIYEFGVVGTEIGPSLWIGFTTWLKMVGASIVIFILTLLVYLYEMHQLRKKDYDEWFRRQHG